MPQNWRTVRVFISSTFRDMYAERDHLVRIVFPELKERCRQRHVQLIELDLRWGVTREQSEGGGALDICLDTIDTCRPYFIGLLGHRYGSVPSGHEHSITAQEIYHGVLHNYLPRQIVDLRPIVEGVLEGRTLLKEQVGCLVRCYQWDEHGRKYILQHDMSPEDEEMLRSVFRQYSSYQRDRSFFFFRSESLTTKLAGPNIEEFFEADKGTSDKLAALKQHIVRAGLPHFEYDDVEAFGQTVLDTLWARIDDEFPKDRVEEYDCLREEAEFHELFMADRTKRFVGRERLLSGMHAFAEGDTDSRTMVITGEPGSGKSALMARFAEQAIQKHPDWLVIPHFIGASPSSTSLRLTLRRLCSIINRALGVTDEVPQDYRELAQLFPQLLERASENRRILFIIDAVNQFERSDNAHSMRWLQQRLPDNVRVVLSTLPGKTLDALSARHIPPLFETVLGLSELEIKQLAASYLGEIHKEFPTEEISRAFYEKIKAGNPLYIVVALEELRVFPHYKRFGKRVDDLPDNVAELFDQVLERIEGDFNRPLVRDFMSLIACGRHGMTAEDLQTLLNHHAPVVDPAASPVKLPDMLFARLRRAFSAYLFERSGVIDFFHVQLKKAVGARYLREETGRDKAHSIIAEYFERRWCEPYVRALDELPHQLTKARDWAGVERVLCDLCFIEAKCAAALTYDLIRDYSTALDMLPEAQEERRAELEHDGRVRKYTGDLIAYAKGDIPGLDIIPSVQRWTEEEIRADSERIENHPTRLERIRAFSRFVESEASALTKFASQPSFCLQQAYSSASNGPLAATAERFTDSETNMVMLVRPGSQRLGYNPHPALIITIGPIEGHRGGVSCVSVTPDGMRAVSGSSDGALRVWDLETGECLATLKGHTESVRCVSITPDGRKAVSGSDDRMLRAWDIASGEPLATLKGHAHWIWCVSLTPDGRRAISGSWDRTLMVWDLETGECLATLKGHTDDVCAVTITPDGRRAVSGSHDRTLRVWDLETGECLATLHGHEWSVYCVSITPDGRKAVSGSWDGTLRVWDLETGECLATLKGHTEQVYCVSITPDGRRAVSGSDNRALRVWDLEKGEPLAVLHGHTDRVSCVSITPDGRKAVSGSWDGTLRVWDLEKGEPLAALVAHTDWVRCVSLTPDGRRAVSVSDDRRLRIWDLEGGGPLAILKGHRDQVSCVSITPDGRRALSGSWDRTLRVWDLERGEPLATLKGKAGRVECVSITPDGRRAVSGSLNNTLSVWDLESGEPLATLKGHTEWVQCVSITPDGRRAVSGSGDETLRVWDLESGEPLATLKGHTDWIGCVGLTPDGRRAISGSADRTLRIWDIARGESLAALPGHTDLVYCVSITPDGRRAVSGSADRTLRMWDLESGEHLAIYPTRAAVRSISQMTPSNAFVYGTEEGEVGTVAIRNSPMGVPSANVVRTWLDSKQMMELSGRKTRSGRWEARIKATCLWCGVRFPVTEGILDVIRDITRTAGLTPDQSPCLDLPAEAWDEPKLLSECPLCHRPLKFNPFIVDNRGRY